MKLAILACLAALCLAGHGARAAPGEPAKAVIPPPAGPAPLAPAPAGTGPVNAAPPPAAQPAQTGPRTAATARAERRRRSYAACNRASHQRSLRGGKRRRFLIRCRLGYERTRGQQIQGQAPAPGGPAAAPAPAPVQPSRKP